MRAGFNTKRDTSAGEYLLVGDFHALRKRLLQDEFADRLDKPLVYWALPSDRRLPLAFLGRTLSDLLDTPFEELLGTPGVGQKKIASLIMLLTRATKFMPLHDAGITDPAESDVADQRAGTAAATFDPSIVSEALWAEWRATVKRHGLEPLKLGRIAPTLQALPTVIWHTPVGEYVDRSLTKIRQLKTHGEKRVRAILEVFWVMNETLANATRHCHVDVDLVPCFVRPVELWIRTAAEAAELPDVAQLRTSLVEPLLAQIQVDVGSTVCALATNRLGVDGRRLSVRQQAKDMSVTRARVYQLLEECGKVMAVRWPEGKYLLMPLAERFQKAGGAAAELFRATVDLFYPGAPGSLPLVPDSMPGILSTVMRETGSAI